MELKLIASIAIAFITGDHMKLGYSKDKDGESLKNHPDAITNEAGGLAYKITDPAMKLIDMAPTFLNEEGYYEVSEDENKVGYEPVLGKYGCKLNAKLSGLTGRTREIIETAIAVAKGSTPRDLLAIAHWVRKEMNVRSTPQLLLAIAAVAFPKEQRYLVKGYAPKIIQRADEVRDVFAMYTHFFGRPFAKALSKGLADATSKFKETDFLKYDTDDHPTFRDVLLMVDRCKDYPVSQEIFEYLVNKKVVNPEKTPIIAARKKLAEMKTWNTKAEKLAKESHANWEVLLSQFGQTPESKKALWTYLATEGDLGIMALIRNLRNILEADVDRATIRKIAERISNKEVVLKSRQLPFRWFSSYRAIEGISTDDADEVSINILLDALDQALKHSCESLPRFPGVTAIFADNSGSMSSAISQKSSLSVADAANILCAMSLFTCEQSIVGAFGTDVAICRLSKQDKVLTNMNKIRNADTKGMSTNGYRIPEYLLSKKEKVDRIIILTDCQLWNDHTYSEGGQLAPSLAAYRRQVNKDVIVHVADLQGYGKGLTPSSDRKVNLISGFSEKILHRMAEFEGIGTKDEKPVVTLDYIRANF